jgi:hypothetical protein
VNNPTAIDASRVEGVGQAMGNDGVPLPSRAGSPVSSSSKYVLFVSKSRRTGPVRSDGEVAGPDDIAETAGTASPEGERFSILRMARLVVYPPRATTRM